MPNDWVRNTRHGHETRARTSVYGMEVAEIIDLTITYHHIGMIFAQKDYLTILPASSMGKTE